MRTQRSFAGTTHPQPGNNLLPSLSFTASHAPYTPQKMRMGIGTPYQRMPAQRTTPSSSGQRPRVHDSFRHDFRIGQVAHMAARLAATIIGSARVWQP